MAPVAALSKSGPDPFCVCHMTGQHDAFISRTRGQSGGQLRRRRARHLRPACRRNAHGRGCHVGLMAAGGRRNLRCRPGACCWILHARRRLAGAPRGVIVRRGSAGPQIAGLGRARISRRQPASPSSSGGGRDAEAVSLRSRSGAPGDRVSRLRRRHAGRRRRPGGACTHGLDRARLRDGRRRQQRGVRRPRLRGRGGFIGKLDLRVVEHGDRDGGCRGGRVPGDGNCGRQRDGHRHGDQVRGDGDRGSPPHGDRGGSGSAGGSGRPHHEPSRRVRGPCPRGTGRRHAQRRARRPDARAALPPRGRRGGGPPVLRGSRHEGAGGRCGGRTGRLCVHAPARDGRLRRRDRRPGIHERRVYDLGGTPGHGRSDRGGRRRSPRTP